MAAKASPERVRREVLCSPVRDFTGYRLAFDYGNRACWGERTIDLGAVAARRGGDVAIGNVITRLRCAGCGRPPRTVFLENGPAMAERRMWRRFMLQGLFPVGTGDDGAQALSGTLASRPHLGWLHSRERDAAERDGIEQLPKLRAGKDVRMGCTSRYNLGQSAQPATPASTFPNCQVAETVSVNSTEPASSVTSRAHSWSCQNSWE